MNEELKSKLSEVLVKYYLEPDLHDLYVEGISDKIFYKNYLKHFKKDVRVVEIDSIDFSEIYNEKPYIKRDNREKNIELSFQLLNKFNDSRNDIICIVDLDFDYYSDSVRWNKYLYYTDYTSLEMYFFNEDCINNFLNNVLHGFTISPILIIKYLIPVLKDLFHIRLALKQICKEYYDSISFVNIDKSLSFDKK